MESSRISLSSISGDGITFRCLILHDRPVLLTVFLLVVALLIQALAMSSVFWSRARFGARFDPVVYSEHQREQSEASVTAALGLKEAEAARRAVNVQAPDHVTSAMERADQELGQARARQSETEFVQQERKKKADLLILQSETSWGKGLFFLAFQQLESALQMSQDYLPAIKKLAIFHEQRQDLAQARFQWEKAAGIAQAESGEMNEIQQHLSRLTTLSGSTQQGQTGISVPTGMARTESSALSLALVKQSQLPLNDLYDIFFNVQITLGSRGSEPLVDIKETRVEVVFYDQSTTARGMLIPMKTLTSTLQPRQKWVTGTEQILSLNYSAPRGYFRKQAKSFGDSYAFCGFVVRLYYRGQLQDAYAQPHDVLGRYVLMGTKNQELKP